MTDSKTETINEIKNVKRKTALQQFCNYELASRVSLTSRVLSTTLVLLSGITVLSTTDHAKLLMDAIGGPNQSHVTALFSIVVFLMMLLRLELRLSERAVSFRSGGDAYTRLLRKIDMLLPRLEVMQVDELERLGAQLTDEYGGIVHFAREIPGHEFLRLKQNFLQRKAISRALDKDPFQNISDIKNTQGSQTPTP